MTPAPSPAPSRSPAPPAATSPHRRCASASPATSPAPCANFAAPAASAAWILARAAAFNDARTATVIYGAAVRPVTRPGHTPARVTEFTATDGTEKFCQAVDALDAALDAALGLSAPGAARLLVIIGDGEYTGDEPTGGQKCITRLAAADCAVLWITPGTNGPRPWTAPG